MNDHTKALLALVAVMAGAACAFVAGTASGHGRSALAMDRVRFEIPRTKVIAFDRTVALFDTATGAISEYNGSLDHPTPNSQWLPRIKGVGQETSGLLEIQRAEGVNAVPQPTFLVDVITGETWILQRRGNAFEGAWVPVRGRY